MPQGVPPTASESVASASENSNATRAMSRDSAALWSALPDEAQHGVKVLLVEALWRIGEPLSARTMVDVLDGEVSMWEAENHLRRLEMLGVVELSGGDDARATSEESRLGAPYRLSVWGSPEDGDG